MLFDRWKKHAKHAVEPLDEPGFEATSEYDVKIAALPRAGQRVELMYDPDGHERFEVLTPPGEEGGTPDELRPTNVIDWYECERSGYIRPDGSRGYR